jgi:hypothetical protein
LNSFSSRIGAPFQYSPNLREFAKTMKEDATSMPDESEPIQDILSFLREIKTTYVEIPTYLINDVITNYEMLKKNSVMAFIFNQTHHQIGLLNTKMITNRLHEMVSFIFEKMEIEYEIKFYYLNTSVSDFIDFHFYNESKYDLLYFEPNKTENILKQYFEFMKISNEYFLAVQKFKVFFNQPPSKTENISVSIIPKTEPKRVEIVAEPFNQLTGDSNLSFIKDGAYVAGESQYYNLSEDYKFDGKISNSNTLFVLFNTNNNTAICLSNQSMENVNNFCSVFKDFINLSNYTDLTSEQEKDVINFFNLREFYSLEDLKSKATSFETLYEITNSENVDELTEIKSMIRGYIRDNYVIDESPKNIMKASLIHSNIERDLGIYVKESVKFKRALSNVLIGMNLKKRRLSDGIYYYGIVPKTACVSNVNIEVEYAKRLANYKDEGTSITKTQATKSKETKSFKYLNWNGCSILTSN